MLAIRLSSLLLVAAAAIASGCAVDDGAADDPQDVSPSDAVATPLASSRLRLIRENLGCHGGMATMRFTVTAPGFPRYAWYEGATFEGPWTRVADGPVLYRAMWPRERVPLRAEACYDTGCEIKDLNQRGPDCPL
jgi:hypothetical protein